MLAGKLARREVQFYEVDGLRPTSARIRETLFNWLTPGVSGANCLDLFAGSGALGFEALSRGASRVVFVEKDKKMAALIQSECKKFGLDNAEIISADYQAYLERIANTSSVNAAPAFDIIFLDPPYQQSLLLGALERVCALQPKLIYLEDDKPLDEARLHHALENGYQLHRTKKAGQVYYALLKQAPFATI